MKYGPDGQTISVAVDQAGATVRVAVSDQGRGVPGSERDAIWRPFIRGATGKETTGSGIGLSIVHDVAEQHGGRAWVDAAPGGGARFTVTLPAVSAVVLMGRILVVEDNADLADGLAYNLRLEGHEAVIASDGLKGVALYSSFNPDLVLLDLMLPGMDGYDVLRAIRSNGRRIPVIILSARAEEADKVRGFKLDADQYVTKPFGILELLERVASLLRRLRRTLVRRNRSRSVTWSSIPIAARSPSRASKSIYPRKPMSCFWRSRAAAAR